MTLRDSLVGKTVVGLDVSGGEVALRFRCADGSTVVWRTDGDCCSESWWADATALGQLFDRQVTNVVVLELPTPKDDRTRQEVDEAYGVAVVTTGGVATLVFRNSSNGYYGGSAEVSEELPGDEWREIKEWEWSA